MSKSYCAVDGCSNKSDKLGLFRFFKLPVCTERRKEWLEKIGRTDLLKRKDLRPHSYCVCSAHFEDSCLITKLYVTRDAVPSLLLPTDEVENKTVPKFVSISSAPPDEIEENLGYEPQNTFLKLAGWQKKIQDLSNSERKEFALNLHYTNPNTYKLLKSLFEFPNVRALRRQYAKIPLRHHDKVMEYLALKMKSLPRRAKYCTMCLGEMKLKPHLYYDTKADTVTGFHYIDNQATNKIATRAYAIMLQGILHTWRQPLSYAFLPDLQHLEDISSWVDNTITTLYKIGVEVKAIITDQGSNFVKFAMDAKGVTVEKPYFFVGDNKVYYIFDVPKLLCSVRDGLEATDFVYEGDAVSWEFIKMLHQKEFEMGLGMIPNITDAHINPKMCPFPKLQVGLAAQVFSQTVSTALDTHINFKTIAKEANTTSRFVESMASLFDILNSSNVKSDKPLQKAFKDTEEQRYVLTEAFKMFSNLRVIPKDKLDVAPVYGTFQNFQITIQSIWQLYQEISDLGGKQLLTKRLHRDNLDVLFEYITWQKTGNVQPTPVEFSRAFSKIFLSSMLEKTHRTHVNLLPKACSVLSQAYSITKRKDAPSSVLLNSKLTDYQMELPEENPLSYISGYLLFKIYEKHQCHCLTRVINKCPAIHHVFLNREAPFYSLLKQAPRVFAAYIATLETTFVANCASLTSERPGSTILEALKAISVPPLMLCPCFPVEYCIKLFVRLRIFTTLKYNQRKIKEGVKTISVQHL